MEDWEARELQAERIEAMYDGVEDALLAAILAAYLTADVAQVRAATTQGALLLGAALEATRVWEAEAVPELYGEATELAATSQEAVVVASQARFEAMTTTVQRNLDDLAAAFGAQQARWEALQRFSAARHGTRIGVAGLANDIEAHLRLHGITGFVDASGRKWKLSTYAEMAARTTTMEAQLAGVKDRIIARGDDLCRIVGPLDYPDGCPASVMDGPYSITGATTSYHDRPILTLAQAIKKYGVFHPRCRHTIVAAG